MAIEDPEITKMKKTCKAINEVRALLPKGEAYNLLCKAHAVTALTLLLAERLHSSASLDDLKQDAQCFVEEYL